MPNQRTITAANTILMLGVVGLYDVPQNIQGFSADDITDGGTLDQGETSMGVDGRLSGGWVPAAAMQTITLQADSLSNDLFENWRLAEARVREKYVAFGSIVFPATGRQYTLLRGFLRQSTPFPKAQKVLQPRAYTVEWESVTAAGTLAGKIVGLAGKIG